MKRIKHSGAVIAALLAIGCVASPLPVQVDGGARQPPARGQAPATEVDVLRTADASGYRLLAESRFPAPIARVEASSTRAETWLGVENVTDGRLTSAWGPGACQGDPTLTFFLEDRVTIDELALKLSLGQISSPERRRVYVDVWTSDDGGETWAIAATGFNPPETALSSFAFAPTAADAVRLVFRAPGEDICDLLVCYANFIDPIYPWPSPVPSTPASTWPSTPPSTWPSTPPSTWPSTPPSTWPSNGPSTPPSDAPSTPPSTAPSAAPSIPPSTPPSNGTSGCGTYMSFTPGAWGAQPRGGNAGNFLHTHWETIEGADGADDGRITLGIGPQVFTFTNAQALTDFLPASGGSGPIAASATNPASEAGSTLISHTTALKLEVLASGINGTGNLGAVLYTGGGPLNGWTIAAILQLAEQFIGGTVTTLPGGMTAPDLIGVVASINLFFEPSGTPDGVTFTCPTDPT